MNKFHGFFIFFLALSLVVISIRSTFPPAVRKGVIADSSFSVTRAYSHLDSIVPLPHSTGSTQQQVVRDYIVKTCKQAGFAVEIQATTSIRKGRKRVLAANIHNILAKKKGSGTGKLIVLMAHYDSEPNSGGAGDDGAAVAAMLETARALQKSKSLLNDVLLLFTDAEEIGLLGATAFVAEFPLLKEIALVINFEGRGNAGPSSMFEVNAQNGWAVGGYAKSAAHPFANSVGYEVYKNLPNSTDYTIFKDAGVMGLNNAFIDGFANYHSMNDKAANLDRSSMQHHGENMLSLVRYFGDLNVTLTKAPDLTYFNTLGYHLVHYPASLNIGFVILADILFLTYLVIGFRRAKLRFFPLAIGAVVFPAALAITYFLSSFVLKTVLRSYPLYRHFEVNNSYNSHWYFLSMAALAVSCVSFVYWLLSKKLQVSSLYGGVLILFLILTNLLQFAAPSASYLLYVPILFILPAQCIFLLNDADTKNKFVKQAYWNLIALVPAICLIAPMLYFAFVAFALGPNMPFIAGVCGLFTGLLLPVIFPTFQKKHPWLVTGSFVGFFAGIVAAHIGSGYTPQEPLPSSLFYTFNVDSAKAQWRSDFASTDKFTRQFFPAGEGKKTSQKNGLVADAPFLPLAAPIATVSSDSVEHGTRTVDVHFEVANNCGSIVTVEITNQVEVSLESVNKKKLQIPDGGNPKHLSFYGAGKPGFNAVFKLKDATPLRLLVTGSSIGLPTIPNINTSYPVDIIPAQGRSNTTHVSKHFVF